MNLAVLDWLFLRIKKVYPNFVSPMFEQPRNLPRSNTVELNGPTPPQLIRAAAHRRGDTF